MFPMQAEGRTTRCGSIRLFCATQEALQSSEAKAASAQVTLQAATLSAECGAAALIGTDRVFCEGGGLRVGTESWAVRAQRTVCERQRKPSRAQHCQTPRTASAMAPCASFATHACALTFGAEAREAVQLETENGMLRRLLEEARAEAREV
jgi:hypothetical protein